MGNRALIYAFRVCMCLGIFGLGAAGLNTASAQDSLTVLSSPISGVQINFGANGNTPAPVATPYSSEFERDDDIDMQAPAEWQGRTFIEWLKNGVAHSTEPSISYSMGLSPVSFTAVYGPPTATLRVTSSPNENIEFQNEDIYFLTTPYERVFEGEIPYDAIVRAPIQDNGKPFARWVLNGAEYSKFHIAYITMDQDYDLEAQFGSGSIKCKIQPPEARKKARWRVDGGEWMRRGKTVSGLLVGDHVVEWKPIAGYKTPKTRVVPVLDGNAHVIRGRYFPLK